MGPEPGTWRVVGRIVGPSLPESIEPFGEVLVGPLPSGIKPLERVSGFNATPSADNNYVAHGPDVRVSSSTYFWVDIAARTSAEAVEAVQSHHALQLQAALTLRVDKAPYMVEVLWATDGKRNEGNWATSLSTALFEPHRLEAEALAEAQMNFVTIVSDEAARDSAEQLATAIRQQATAGNPADRQAALLSFFKVVERIANELEPADPPDREEKEALVLARLEKKLAAKKSHRKRVGAVADAETQLARLGQRYLSLRIESAAEVLGMSIDWKRDVQKFGKLRNKQLGHAGGTGLTMLGFAPDRLAREMLRAYVDRLGDRG